MKNAERCATSNIMHDRLSKITIEAAKHIRDLVRADIDKDSEQGNTSDNLRWLLKDNIDVDSIIVSFDVSNMFINDCYEKAAYSHEDIFFIHEFIQHYIEKLKLLSKECKDKINEE